ncbi:MAG: histidine kinase [Rubrivivax sp.]|nr:histidine kinase [Rubrivivax sp.]
MSEGKNQGAREGMTHSPPLAPNPGDAARAGAWWQQISGIGVLLAGLLGLLAAVVLNPIFATPFPVLLGRTLFLAMVLLLAYTLGLNWPARWRPTWLPPWLLPPLMVSLAAPLATLAIYLLWVGGDIGLLMRSEPAQLGFLWISGTGLIVGLMLSLGALLREQEARGRQQALRFELERATLERQALDARLALLQQQIEPHFLFNTLANVQALVEAGSPRAPALLQSLIDYLRASVPDWQEGGATWGRELTRTRAYLELMRMRMPDRLELVIAVDPELDRQPFPAMALLTLVENAVRHGIDPAENGGRIDVIARREPGGWRVVVADTGVGLAHDVTAGTGLSNLRERLQAFYGGRARLELGENRPCGVRAEIVIEDARHAG